MSRTARAVSAARIERSTALICHRYDAAVATAGLSWDRRAFNPGKKPRGERRPPPRNEPSVQERARKGETERARAAGVAPGGLIVGTIRTTASRQCNPIVPDRDPRRPGSTARPSIRLELNCQFIELLPKIRDSRLFLLETVRVHPEKLVHSRRANTYSLNFNTYLIPLYCLFKHSFLLGQP